ncbi:hypothetical protein LTR53_013264, partial [Teratosphaeriaceae sp. CCFEE 6253]
MPEAAPAPAAAGQSWEDKAWSIGKNVLIFFGIQFAIRQFISSGGQKAAQPAPSMAPASGSQPISEYNAIPQTIYPLWPSNVSVDVSLYISPSIAMPRLSSMPAESLIIEVKGFELEKSKKDRRDVEKTFKVPPTVQDNGTLWAHIFVGQSGAELDPAAPSYDPSKAYRMLRPLTQYLAKKKVRKTRSLLSAANETEVIEEPTEDTGPSIASYYHPNFTLSFVPDAGEVQYPTLHPGVRQYYTLEPSGARDETGKNTWFYPVIYLNTF